MSLVFAGVCSHGPGINSAHRTGGAQSLRAVFSAAYVADGRRLARRHLRPDALVIIAAEHFANFFMNNMPSLSPSAWRTLYSGPIEESRLACVFRGTTVKSGRDSGPVAQS